MSPLSAADRRETAVLIMLDISAASDTVDSATVMNCLETWMSVKGTALSWFSSYLYLISSAVHSKVPVLVKFIFHLHSPSWPYNPTSECFLSFLCRRHTDIPSVETWGRRKPSCFFFVCFFIILLLFFFFFYNFTTFLQTSVSLQVPLVFYP